METDPNWEFIGKVSIESGQLLLADPAFLDDCETTLQELADAVIQTDLLEIFQRNQNEFKNIAWEDVPRDKELVERLRALSKLMGSQTFPNGIGNYFGCKVTVDGVYPVFAKIKDKKIAGLFIDLENFADE